MSSARAHMHQERLIRQLRRRRRRAVQLQRRQRRQRIMGGTAALALAVGSAFGVASLTGTDLSGAAVARASSLMELLERRSPGGRTEAQLTKMRHMAVADHLPAAPTVQLPVQLTELVAPPSALIPVNIEAPPAELQLLAPPPTPLAIFMSPPGGGGGGGPPGGPPGAPPNLPPSNPPALPEPGTWLTMLAGFGLMGWALRRQKPHVAAILAR